MQYDLNLIFSLADECEKGNGPDRHLNMRIECATKKCNALPPPNFTSSIDDAEALRNRLLPESGIDVVIPAKGVRNYGRHRATVFGYETDLLRCSEASSEPRARTAAALRAFVAKERAK